jgi:hypothetical protein
MATFSDMIQADHMYRAVVGSGRLGRPRRQPVDRMLREHALFTESVLYRVNNFLHAC